MSLNRRSFRFACFAGTGILCVLCSVLFSLGAAWAKPVTAWQAQRVVARWLSWETRPLGAAVSPQIREVVPYPDRSGDIPYFIVHLEPRGLVIVPGDDLVEPIVGFVVDAVSFDPSEDNPLGALVGRDLPGRVLAARKRERAADARGEATVDAASAAAQAKWRLLEGGALGEALGEGGLPTLSDIRVPPLVQSKWSQSTVAGSACYNYYTPNNDVCGCVATAMAQLMRYHNHPAAGVGTPAFTIWVDDVSQTRSLRGGDGAGGAYAWGNMALVPDDATTEAQRQAIGALTHDAGVSVHMSYTAASSGADTLQAGAAFVGTFGYGSGKKGYSAGENLPATQRNHMVNPNLDASHPVLLGIYSSDSGGHAIVCDGYGYHAATLYHHLNMGWSGANDAWYNLPNVDDSSYGFDTVYKAVYNVFPSGTGEIVSGRVTDAGGNPLSGVTITAARSGGGTYAATTGAQGIYALAKIPSASTYTIAASKSGYTFSPVSASTGTSTDGTATTGNWWGANLSAAESCVYSLTPASATASGSSGSGSVSVTASGSDCAWTAQSDASWITVTSGSSGTGSGTVGYAYTANNTGAERTGTIAIAGKTFSLTQKKSVSLPWLPLLLE